MLPRLELKGLDPLIRLPSIFSGSEHSRELSYIRQNNEFDSETCWGGEGQWAWAVMQFCWLKVDTVDWSDQFQPPEAECLLTNNDWPKTIVVSDQDCKITVKSRQLLSFNWSVANANMVLAEKLQQSLMICTIGPARQQKGQLLPFVHFHWSVYQRRFSYQWWQASVHRQCGGHEKVPLDLFRAS